MENPLAFTEKDWELLQECIRDWESFPAISEAFASLAELMISPRTREEQRVASKAANERAEKKAASRRQMSIMLKAKIEYARQQAQQAAINAAPPQG